MNNVTLAATLVATAMALAHSPAQACGENQFNMGQGLRYQGYLAPRPATVLVFDAAATDRRALYAGLQKAGHRLSVVASADELARALQQRHFDVVISDFDYVASVEADVRNASTKPQLLPVIERSRRNAPELRDRFELFLLEGASLGQYLKSIDRLVKGPAG